MNPLSQTPNPLKASHKYSFTSGCSANVRGSLHLIKTKKNQPEEACLRFCRWQTPSQERLTGMQTSHHYHLEVNGNRAASGLSSDCWKCGAKVSFFPVLLFPLCSSACLPASGLAAKIPTLISFQALGWALCELPLLTPDKVNEERNWPPAETKGKAKSVCEGNTPLFTNHSSAGSCRFGLF